MSLVRYNTHESLEPIDPLISENDDDNDDIEGGERSRHRVSKDLAMVYRDRVSNQVVLYNSASKGFQIVKLKQSGERLSDGSSDENSGTPPPHDYGPGRRRSFTVYLEDGNDDVDSRQVKHVKRADTSGGFNSYNWRNHRRLSVDTIDDVYRCSACGSYNHVPKAQFQNHYRRRNPLDGDADIHSSSSTDDIVTIDSTNRSIERRWSDFDDNLRNYQPYNFSRTSNGNLMRGDYFKLLANSMRDSQEALLTDGNNTASNGPNNYGFETIPESLINQGYFDKFFRILCKLGSGSFGSVYKVEHELLGLNLGVFALKKIPIGDDVNNLKKILNEVKFLYDISCNFSDNNYNNNNVVKYNHVWVEIDQVSRFTPKIPVVFLLFEYCDGGTLEEWVENTINPKHNIQEEKLLRGRHLKGKGSTRKPRYLNNYEIFKVFNDITQGLNYLHGLKILHRDLKPSNCLFKTKFDESYNLAPLSDSTDFDKIPTLVVSDFGESIMVSSLEESLNATVDLEATGATGTLEFCAPEIILERRKAQSTTNLPRFGGFSFASDIYSLGMILYYLCFGELPFSKDKNDPEETCSEILSADLFDKLYTLRPIVSSLHYNEEGSESTDAEREILADWIQLIEQMVCKDPKMRPDVSTIMDSLIDIYQKLELRKVTNDDNASTEKHSADTIPVLVADTDQKIIPDKESLILSSLRSENGSDRADKRIPEPHDEFKTSSAVTLFSIAGNLYLWSYVEELRHQKMTSALTNIQFLIIGLWIGGRLTTYNMLSTQIILFGFTIFLLLSSNSSP